MISKKNWFALGGLAFLLAGCASVTSTDITSDDEVVVDFNQKLGPLTYRTSGFIYGLTENGEQPDKKLLSEIKLKFLRAGGAQLGCPNGGYVNNQYERRWKSVKGYYARAKEVGATFILLPHDLWGADGACLVPFWPGDNGDWTEFTNFLNRVISDAKANGMTGSDVQWDIWNEPDLLTPVQFWGRDQQQYLEMWKRAFRQIRKEIPDAIIVGPSSAGQPSPDWQWFTTYLDYIKENNVIPDYISWHQLIPENDPQITKDRIDRMLSERGILVNGYQVNEYGSNAQEQLPGPSIWYIARFERLGIDALRANWGMAGGLYQGMGDLVTPDGKPLPSWWAYQRYASLTGTQVNVAPGSKVDGLATFDTGLHSASILIGSRAGVSGQVTVKFKNLSSSFNLYHKIGIKIDRIPAGTDSISSPIKVYEETINAYDTLTIPINWIENFDGYVITITG